MATVARAERTSEPCRWAAPESVEENLRQARRAVTTARYAAEDALGEATLNIRRHPLPAVGAAFAGGLVAGIAVGVAASFFAPVRR